MHSDFPYTKQEINVYLMDVFDHISRVVDTVDTFRESMTGLLELQMSLKGDRMNAIENINDCKHLFSTVDVYSGIVWDECERSARI